MPPSVQHFSNPIIPGFAPDPSVVHVDGVYYLCNSTFQFFPGLPIYASRDLQNWTHIGNAFNRTTQLPLGGASSLSIRSATPDQTVLTLGLFAPSIRHHNGTFYIVCTNTYKLSMPFALQNFVISTTDIWSGNWSDPVPIDFDGLDPSIFFDDDGKVYFHGCFNLDRMKQPSGTIKQMEIDIKTGKPLSELTEIWGGHTRHDTEGPHMYKHGGWYYLLVAEGGTFKEHLLSIARSRSVWGPFETYSTGNPIMTARGTTEPIQNIGHGELFQDRDGRWWAAVLGVRDCNGDGYPPMGRETFLTPVDWPEGGWPTVAQPKLTFTREALSNASESSAWPDFREPENASFLYHRTPVLSDYVLPEPGSGSSGRFRLTARPGLLSALKGTATFIGTRQRHISTVASASIAIADDAPSKLSGVTAGLVLFKDHLRHVTLNHDFSKNELSCRYINTPFGRDDVTTIASGPVRDGPPATKLRLRIAAHPDKYIFEVGRDRGCWEQVFTLAVKDFVSQEMTGPIFGIFAHAPEEKQGQQVDFPEFSVRSAE